MTPPVDPARYLAYLSVMTVMVVTPGPANLFAIATGAQRGRAAVLSGVAGMNLASLVWFVAAGLGLGVLASAFPGAFRVLAYGGAAYVAWLGLREIWSARADNDAQTHAPDLHHRSAFMDGFAVQLANPKALLFVTAVLPPFIDAARPMLPQMAVFAATSIVADVIAMTAYGFGGVAIAARMNEPRFRRAFGAFTGLLLVAAAILIAIRG
jgi:threonine/homoserine/homoserine lactone efflux protein